MRSERARAREACSDLVADRWTGIIPSSRRTNPDGQLVRDTSFHLPTNRLFGLSSLAWGLPNAGELRRTLQLPSGHTTARRNPATFREIAPKTNDRSNFDNLGYVKL